VLAFATALTVLVGTLHGTVMRGPTTPVCRVDVPCDEPAAQITLSFSRHGQTRRAKTDLRGRYRISLAAGLYTVRTSERPFGRIPDPGTARVRAGGTRRVDFVIDTGIR
jgi:hypothetical protein